MKTTDMQVHEGKNIKRIREILGIKQESLAIDLGLTQQAVSLLEQRETLDAPILEKVAKSLKIPVEAIKNFDEEKAVNITNDIHDNKFDNSSVGMVYQQIINPIERWIEALEENKKLYERLLQSEREKVALLEKLVEKK